MWIIFRWSCFICAKDHAVKFLKLLFERDGMRFFFSLSARTWTMYTPGAGLDHSNIFDHQFITRELVLQRYRAAPHFNSSLQTISFIVLQFVRCACIDKNKSSQVSFRRWMINSSESLFTYFITENTSDDTVSFE